LDGGYPGATIGSYGYYQQTGEAYTNGNPVTYGTTYTTGDVIGVALDSTAGKIYFSKNGTWQNTGDPVAGTNPALTGITGLQFPAAALYSLTGPHAVTGRFKLAGFSTAPPSGYSAWGT
jgi:hypothetical protein